jgi:hypothetical protein
MCRLPGNLEDLQPEKRKIFTSEAPGDPAEVRPLEDILPGRMNEERRVVAKMSQLVSI